MKVDKSSADELSQDLKQWSKVSNPFYLLLNYLCKIVPLSTLNIKMIAIHVQLQVLTPQCERYGGEDLVAGQETLEMLTNLQESWIEVCLQLFRRHPGPDGEPPKGQEAMRELAKTITELQNQLAIRINGESGKNQGLWFLTQSFFFSNGYQCLLLVINAGIHATLMLLIESMEFWSRKLKALSELPEEQSSDDSLKLEEALANMMNLSEEALLIVDSTQLERDRAKKKPHSK